MTERQPDGERSRKQVQRSPFKFLAAAKWTVVVSVAALALTALFALQRDAESAAPLNPTLDCDVSDHSLEANADVLTDFAIPAGDANYEALVTFTPPEFWVAADADVPDGARVASLSTVSTLGLLNNVCTTALPVTYTMLDCTTDTADTVSFQDGFADANANGLPDACDKYPEFLNTMFPGITPRARYYGQASVAGTPMSMNLVIFEPGTALPGLPPLDPSLGYPSVTVLNNPTTPPLPNAITDFCTPLSSVTTTFGISKDNPSTTANEGGYAVRTNPTTSGEYTVTAYARSMRDADGDGIENDLDTCPFDVNEGDPRVPGSGDNDHDGIDNACDPTPDENTGPGDHDGDNYPNRGDNCPLVFNNGTDSDDDAIGDACDPHPYTPDGLYLERWFDCALAIPEYCPPVFPGTYTGTVTIDGSPAPNGTVISAIVEGIVWASRVTSGANYVVDIPQTMPITPPCFQGGWITFYADGLACAPVVEWAPGLHDLNLDCGQALVGDANGDGEVDAVDAMFILQYVVGLREGSEQCPPSPGEICLPLSDADCDGDVDAVDALFVLQHVVGLRPVLCPAG